VLQYAFLVKFARELRFSQNCPPESCFEHGGGADRPFTAAPEAEWLPADWTWRSASRFVSDMQIDPGHQRRLTDR
jgi:hypothetical protein